jgi:hypothetical protein
MAGCRTLSSSGIPFVSAITAVFSTSGRANFLSSLVGTIGASLFSSIATLDFDKFVVAVPAFEDERRVNVLTHIYQTVSELIIMDRWAYW